MTESYKTENVRQMAWQFLNKCASAEQYSNLALDTALRRGALSPQDRALLTVLLYGTLERQLTLDYQIEALSDRGARKIDLSVRNLLRLGLYQLAFLDRVPDHAAVNETVALAPKQAKGFVNAILRAFLRKKKQMVYPDKEPTPIEYLSVRYSFAPAICQRFVELYGFDRTERLLEAFCVQPPMTLRTNTLRVSREELLERLRKQGIEAVPTRESRSGILLSGAPLASLTGFEEGDFFVQDEASQLCVEALDVRAGMTLIDTCACPGSKSFGAAIEMGNEGRVISCDLHANKLSLVKSGADRLGISVIETETRDGRCFCEEWEGVADRVLCDVPCSGFGVFAKKPELRYKDPQKCETLPDIQLAITQTAARYVKVGGLLVYSTCTLLPCENRENVERFLRLNPNFSLIRDRTLFPDVDATDGFYYAVLRREK